VQRRLSHSVWACQTEPGCNQGFRILLFAPYPFSAPFPLLQTEGSSAGQQVGMHAKEYKNLKPTEKNQ